MDLSLRCVRRRMSYSVSCCSKDQSEKRTADNSPRPEKSTRYSEVHESTIMRANRDSAIIADAWSRSFC